MTSHGIPALPRELANQRAFSSHVTSIVQGRESTNDIRQANRHNRQTAAKCCITLHGAYRIFYSFRRYASPITLVLPL